MLHADSFKALDHPVVKECSSGLLIEMPMENTPTTDYSVGHPMRLVCYPPAKTTDVRPSNLEEADALLGPGLLHSDARGGIHSGRVFKLMISDKARFVSLFHYDGQWRVCSSELADCSDAVLRVTVPMPFATPRPDTLAPSADEKEECTFLEYLAFKSRTHYNYWEIMEETLIKPRQAFASFVNRARKVDPTNWEGTGQGLTGSGRGKGSATRSEHESEAQTLGDYFWEIWRERGYQLPEDTSLCYTFMVSVAAIDACEHLPSQGVVRACARKDVRAMSSLMVCDTRRCFSRTSALEWCEASGRQTRGPASERSSRHRAPTPLGIRLYAFTFPSARRSIFQL
jgi:hypothetical protein